MSATEYIPPGTVLTCHPCGGTGRIRWYGWFCCYCDGTGRVVHMPNTTTAHVTYTTVTPCE